MVSPLEYLKSIRDQLEKVPYEVIYERVAAIRKKMLPSSLIKKGHLIDRVRINEPGDIKLQLIWEKSRWIFSGMIILEPSMKLFQPL